jgi:radical SAM protein with 4Fe4S-binding SPASM domain
MSDPGSMNLLWIDGRNPPLLIDNVAADFVSCIIDESWRAHDLGNTEDGVSIFVRTNVVDSMYAKYGGKRLFTKKPAVTRQTIAEDLDRIFGILMRVGSGDCPVPISDGMLEIRYDRMKAPARMDLAVTYRCNLLCKKCYNENRGVKRELTTVEWLNVFRKLFDEIGVPQIVFTGGEPLLRTDIVKLIDSAQQFVTGLVSNGTMLAENAGALVDASLDYAQVTIESHDAAVHNRMTEVSGAWEKTVAGIREALRVGLSVSTNTTIMSVNADFPRTVRFLVEELGVRNVGCNELICSGKGTGCRIESGLPDTQIAEILQEAAAVAEGAGAAFQWYSPTCYHKGVNPIELGFGPKACSAAQFNMTVEPDGSVIPCQSYASKPLGNILKDSWDSIWNHETSEYLRSGAYKSPECGGCTFESVCRGGCPLDVSERINNSRKKGG